MKIEIKDFCENLAEMTKLQKLDLKNETFYGKFNTYLLDAISKLKHLIILKLPENCLMGLSEALINECLISLVYSLNKLSSLDLNTNFNFIAEGTKTIDNLVKINTLNDLAYTNDNTYNRSFDYLIGKLYKLSNLTNLDISGLLFHNISDLQFNKICNSIDMHPKIQKVAVNNISITRILELKSKTQKYKQDLAAEYLATFLIYKNVVSKRTKPSDKNSLLELISNLPVELIFYICKVITNASLIPTKTLIEKYKSNLDYILKNKCSLKYRESILKPQKEQPLLFNQKEIIAVKPVSRTNVSAEIETKAKRKLMFK